MTTSSTSHYFNCLVLTKCPDCVVPINPNSVSYNDVLQPQKYCFKAVNMPYHGENHVRADQQPVTWLNCKGHNTMHKQNRIEQRFHAEFPYTGPTTNDLRPKLQVDVVWNLWKQIEVQRKTQVMLYTREGEGCRLLERDSRGRTSSIRPGRDYRPLRTATNAIEAAVANKFYPHQEYKIMAVSTPDIFTRC